MIFKRKAISIRCRWNGPDFAQRKAATWKMRWELFLKEILFHVELVGSNSFFSVER